MSARRWANVSYLDAIRPEPGWRTEYALLASYSADLVALVAALLALAGVDDDRGSGSKVDFANAVDQLADRVRLVAQAGRLVAPAKTPRILAILDRYVREVQLDESAASWHPKVALTKQASEDGSATQWRLWVGSRNLTRDLAWDVGLALVGRPSDSGSEIPGIPELAHTLADHADLPGVSPTRVRSELRAVRWETPPGCALKALRLLGRDPSRALPNAPPHLRRLIVVSPFLDGTVVRSLGTWGDAETNRILVSSRAELAKLAVQAGKPLRGFKELLFLDAPVPDEQTASDLSERENANSQDEEPEPRGLHAKLIYAEAGNRRLVWTGSANATQRGWEGPNWEILVEMEVSREVAAGLESFVTELVSTVQLNELGDPLKPSDIDERLELARKQVAGAWRVTQRIDADSPFLASQADPNPVDKEITLTVGLFSTPQVLWPRGATTVRLPRILAGEATELVCCRLTLGETSVSWLQRSPLEPPPGEERDRQALARYLDPRTFLLWIRSLLMGAGDSDGGGDWDEEPRDPVRRNLSPASPDWWAPTLEEVLRAWSRDPSSLLLVDKKVRHYLKLYQARTDTELTAEERLVVEEFHKSWQTLRRVLISEER